MLTDNDIMPFGKFQKTGTSMANVPASYLLWLNENGSSVVRIKYPEVFEYIRENLSTIMTEVKKEKWQNKN